MLSWALKRNVAPRTEDTQINEPDTPAPVFAVRAIRTLLLGTPAPRDSEPDDDAANVAGGNNGFGKITPGATDARSPSRPQGILLTPGTITSRRKRVSFNKDTKAGSAVLQLGSKSGIPDDCPGKFPSPWKPIQAESSKSRPRSTLNEALANSRKPVGSKRAQQEEDQWEETDDADGESDVSCDADVTVDLNEPKSHSGRYWKSNFESYQGDAKAQMEKLVKYKMLVKSFAKQKDAEVVKLTERLRDEQQKVRKMESQLAEAGRRVTMKASKDGGQRDSKLVEDLAKQTQLALEYKNQVNELEQLLHGMDQDSEDKGARQRRVTSPRTQRTILETQRELRRARNQVKDLEKLGDECGRLKSELKFAEQRANKLAEENKKMSGDLLRANSKVQDLERDVARLTSEARQRDRDLKRLREDHDKLREDHDKLKENAKARFVEAEEVLKSKNDTISTLTDAIKSLKSDVPSKLSTKTEDVNEKHLGRNGGTKSPDQENAVKLVEVADEESALLKRELNKLRATSIKKGLITESRRSRTRETREPYDTKIKSLRRHTIEDVKGPVSSGNIRDNFEAETGPKNSSSALSERGNFQDTRDSPLETEPVSQADGLATKLGVDVAKPSSSAPASTLNDDLRVLSRVRPLSTTLDHARKPTAPSLSSDEESPQIDLVQSRFARLGGPDVNSNVWSTNTSRITMPADRRASAIARLERKRAERQREQLKVERNKENMRP